MKIDDAVKLVSDKFIYRSDSIRVFDSWSVMRNTDGHLYGDCEDFALTCIWYACDKNVWKFFLYVFILHKYRIWFCMTKKGVAHAVGYAEGKFFDNFTREALDKDAFFEKTKHKRKFVYPSPFIILYMTIGGLFLLARLAQK